MIEREGDLWQIAEAEHAAVVITTNGSVRKDGCAVMGRGCALEAKQRFPGIDRTLGEAISQGGNHVRFLPVTGPLPERIEAIIAYPVKRIWQESAELSIISRSALELVDLVKPYWKHIDTSKLLGEIKGLRVPASRVVMPRPGCGNGWLRWADVKPVLDALLPGDRFIVVHRPGDPG